MKIKPENLKDLLISEAAAVDEAARRAVRHALLTHKRAGHAISAWRNGEVVIIPPEEIEVEEGAEEQGRWPRES
jgi:predicted nucleic acid-binding protein